MPRPLSREEQHFEPPFKLIEESEESGESEEEFSLEDKPIPDIPE
jgi:hypothetical protein